MLLLIDTAQENGFVGISREGEILFSEENKVAKDHARWLHTAVGRLLVQAGITLRDLKAVSVVAGPGSYTGIRVGMAAAKGFCYALKIPLITQNTLRVMAASQREDALETGNWICPMIDARRDEVFTGVYDSALGEVLAPQALILDKNSFETVLDKNKIVFFGSGAAKFNTVINNPQAIFLSQYNTNQGFADLSFQDFRSGLYADPVYSEPIYLKEFFTY